MGFHTVSNHCGISYFTMCHSEPAGEESRTRDPCAAAKALATRGREYPQDDGQIF